MRVGLIRVKPVKLEPKAQVNMEPWSPAHIHTHTGESSSSSWYMKESWGTDGYAMPPYVYTLEIHTVFWDGRQRVKEVRYRSWYKVLEFHLILFFSFAFLTEKCIHDDDRVTFLTFLLSFFLIVGNVLNSLFFYLGTWGTRLYFYMLRYVYVCILGLSSYKPICLSICRFVYIIPI